MDDFHNDGGVPQLIHQIKDNFNLEAKTMSQNSWGEILKTIPLRTPSGDGLRTLDNPVSGKGGLKVLRGNLAPEGAVIKVSAATPELLRHEAQAVVFESIEDMMNRIDDPALEVDAHSILVLKNAGPVAAGMPEAGALPIPSKVAKTGVKDMVRISDARMSGTAFGTVVLHVSPEAGVGGPLAVVKNGDVILLDATNNLLQLMISEEEIAKRLADHKKISFIPETHWGKIYKATVQQAHLGADVDLSSMGES